MGKKWGKKSSSPEAQVKPGLAAGLGLLLSTARLHQRAGAGEEVLHTLTLYLQHCRLGTCTHSPKLVALTPQAENWPSLSIPAQSAAGLQGPGWDCCRESCGDCRARPCLLTRLQAVCSRSHRLG